MNYYKIIVILIVLIIILMKYNNIKECFTPEQHKYIWIYWENAPGKQKPYYIDLCHQLIKKFNPNATIITLNKENITKYVTVPKEWYNLKLIAHRADYARIAVLYKYGGIYIDSDMITLNSYDKIFDLLKTYDFVGFEYGKNEEKNKNVKHTYRTFVGCLATRPGNIMFKEWLKLATEKIVRKDNNDWHFLGRDLMNKLLRKYVESGQMSYYSFNNEKTVTPYKIATKENYFSTTLPLSSVVKIEYQPFITLYNSFMPKLKLISKDNINSSQWLVCKVFRYAQATPIVVTGLKNPTS
jgi:mannosyltransferase OCH1-like enzyme